jgi:serralysin
MKITAAFSALLLSSSSLALASAHLWEIQEVYTNADGSVQFVEFFTTASGEFFLTGGVLEFAIDGIPVDAFSFPNDLSGDTTADRTFLVATANFEAIHGVKPDYIMPPNFLSASLSGSLNFGPGPDRVLLGELPTNGIASLNALPFDESPEAFRLNAFATPRNFNGVQVTIPEPSTALLVASGAISTLVSRRRGKKKQCAPRATRVRE